MSGGADSILEVWERLTPVTSVSVDASQDLRVVSWDQLVQLMHNLRPTQLCNTSEMPNPDQAAIRVAAQWYNLEDSDIVGQSRRSYVSQARKLACLLMRDIGNMSYDSIGHALNRDHTTILYLVKSARRLIEDKSSAMFSYRAMHQALMRFVNKHKHGYNEQKAGEQAVAGNAQRAPLA